MALLKVLLFIEAEFGFWMPDEDLVEENIKTARGDGGLHLPTWEPVLTIGPGWTSGH